MFVERFLCKCLSLPRPIRHLQSSRQIYIGQTKTARRKVQVEKELPLTTVTYFMGVFECSYNKAYKILNEHKTLKDIRRDRLEMTIQMCGRFGIHKEEILDNPDVLAILPVTIENHSMLLEESGFTRITAHSLVNYIHILKKRISLLKAYGYIPPDTDVAESFLSHVEPEVQGIGLVRSVKDSKLCIAEVGMSVFRRYLAWRLHAEPKQLDAIFKTYHRIRHKSLRLTRRTLDLLEFDIGFTKEKILKNGFLIHSNPENTELMLKEVESLGDVPIRTLLTKYPKIIATSVETMKKTKKHLMDFGITDEAVRKCPEIFTLGSDTVHERLAKLQVVPEFSVLLTHPRILRLVYFQKKAQSRLEFLREMRVKCVSLHILSGPEYLFEKYAKEGADKTKGTDISHFLGQELEHKDETIRSSLTRHPYWCHVPLVAVRETMDFLLQAGFTKKQIVTSVQILLYPKDRVAKELANLSSHPELSAKNLLPLGPDWVPPPSPHAVDAGLPDYRLQLCMYYIEREHHFTGNGIWTHTQSLEGLQSEVVSHSPLTQLASYKQRLT